MTTEEEWMEAEGFHYVEDAEAISEIDYEYTEEDYLSLTYLFKHQHFPSLDEWSYYCNEYD